jgi:hypothetical protein
MDYGDTPWKLSQKHVQRMLHIRSDSEHVDLHSSTKSIVKRDGGGGCDSEIAHSDPPSIMMLNRMLYLAPLFT